MRKFLIVLAALMAILLVVGCAGENPLTPPPDPTPTARPTTAPPPPAATPVAGGGIRTQSLQKWPSNPAEAAQTFCVVVSSNADNRCDASRWELNPDGGWHLREEAFQVSVNPKGYLAEGYYDTKPGKNAQCFLYHAPMGVQGITIWPEPGTRQAADNLFSRMAVAKWDDGTTHPCQVMIQ